MQLFCPRSMSLSAQITPPITSLNSKTWCYHSRTSLTVLLFFKWMTGTDQSKSSLNKTCTLLETTQRQLKIYTFDNISVNIVHPLSWFTVFFTKEKEKKRKELYQVVGELKQTVNNKILNENGYKTMCYSCVKRLITKEIMKKPLIWNLGILVHSCVINGILYRYVHELNFKMWLLWLPITFDLIHL